MTRWRLCWQKPEAGLDLQIELDPALPQSVIVDEHRLRQVLLNLVSNAVKFTRAGTVTLSIRCRFTSHDKADLLFSIRDTGIGIAKDKQSKIFAPFTQEDGSITRRFGGTGLGLAICRQLVELMGGGISLRSEVGVGSNFYFTLNVDVESAHPVTVDELNNLRSLIIGNRQSRDVLIKRECEKWGIEANVIEEGTETVTGSGSYDVILYCQQSIARTLSDISQIRLHYPDAALVLCSRHSDEHYDFRDLIDGMVTLPLLGKRFTKAVLGAVSTANDQFAVSQESTVPGIAVTAPPAEGELILVVEDNQVNQKVALLFLAWAGYRSEVVNNGKEAVEAIKQGKPFCAVLMDCMMPVMDGFTATEEIRRWESDTRASHRLPIIALTASVLDEDIEKCFDVGMDDYIAKPFKKEVLLQKLKQLVRIAEL